MRFRVGERVQVSPDYFWAGGAIGIVSAYPDFGMLAPNQKRVDATTMSISGGKRPSEETGVIFDEPQYDLDGDGPYTEAAMDCSALTRVR